MNKILIETQQLYFSFKKEKVIQNLNLQIEQNSIYGLLGPNGAGKTTSLKLLVGLLYPPKNTIYYSGKEFNNNRNNILAKVGVLINTPSIYNHLTARENLNYLRIIYRQNKARIEEVLCVVGLTQNAEKKVSRFSHGMRQRLGIAFAIFNKPDVLILDEPSNGLDPQGIREIRELLLKINRDNVTILVSSHLLSEVEKLCTHIGIIKKGKLIYQNPIDVYKGNGKNEFLLKVNDCEKVEKLCNNNRIKSDVINNESVKVIINDEKEFNKLIYLLTENNVNIYDIEKSTLNLEEYYINLINKA